MTPEEHNQPLFPQGLPRPGLPQEEQATAEAADETADTPAKKKIRPAAIVFLALICVVAAVLTAGWVLYLTSDYKAFKDLRKDYAKRVEGVDGVRVTQVEELEDFYYFSVEITVQAESDPSGEAFVVSEASALCFRNEEDAETSYKRYEASQLDTCMRQGKILIFWRSDDPYQDLYREVFDNAFGS